MSSDPTAQADPAGHGLQGDQKNSPFETDTVRDLNYQLKQLCQRHREGSFATRVQRERELSRMANQLHQLGYRHLRAESLKPKHVEALVRQWQAAELAVGTLKNRMAVLRWWAEKVNKQHVIARANDHYGIPNRQYVATASRARHVNGTDLSKVGDTHVRMSLELQQAFGLRREEAIKFNPAYADRGDHIVLKGSWTKGGKPRGIPVRTAEQRDVLNRARQLAGRGALIPGDRNYRQQLRIYEGHTLRAGLSKLHGLRHAYAQRRYQELAGWACPAAGGRATRDLSAEQRGLDQTVRLIISRELGHERSQITAVYLGR